MRDKSREELEQRIKELESELRSNRRFHEPHGDAVLVPEQFKPIFDQAQQTVCNFFKNVESDPTKGTIEIGTDRYVLVRASALSVDFLESIVSLYADRGPEEAFSIGKNFLFDISHLIGMSDAKNFHMKMGLEDPISKLSAGPAHFSHAGWALVDILSESNPSPDENYFLIYHHPFSFEADSWINAGKTSTSPVCIMNAGYSSGWCEESFGIPLTAVEIVCRAKGDDNCTFIMAPPDRIEGHLRKNLAELPERVQKYVVFDIPTFFERKRVEQKLKASEQRFRAIFEGANDGILAADIETTQFIFVNSSICELTGYSKEELIGYDINKIHAAGDLPYVTDQFRRLAEEKIKTAMDIPVLRKDGTIVHCDISGKVTEIGGERYIVGFFRDISNRKQAERAILSSERLSAIGELASGIAHDFNNSLQGIFGNIELALLRDMPPEVKGYLEIIKKSASDAASRIQQLQRFAGKKSQTQEYGAININELVDDAISQTRNLWKDEAQKNGLAIEINRNYEDNLQVLGNQGELRSVLYNIIKNSVQSMPDGGIMDLATRRDDESVYLTVTDTGEGMDESVQKRIFQPFYSTKGFEQGKGLGMSGAYSIIREHKGEIYVKRTAPGKGTSIEIMLPYTEQKASQEKEDNQEYEGSARVLWVDDEEMIRHIGEQMITLFGHKVDTASCGKEALELLAKTQYDLMITDVGMPGMSGWQLAEQIKGKYSGMKVAVVTGWGADVEPEQKEKYGVGYVLGKPIQMDQLKGLVGEALQMKTK